jgi:hypothetical protein
VFHGVSYRSDVPLICGYISPSALSVYLLGPDPSEVLTAGQTALHHEITSLRQMNFMMCLLLHWLKLLSCELILKF